MKKIILWLLLLTAYALPQTPIFNYGMYGMGLREVKFTIDTLGLTTTDTISTHWFNSKTFNEYMDGFFTLFDSAAVTDTFYVQRADTLDPYKTYTNLQMAYVDVSTTNPTTSVTGQYGNVGSYVIIPGAGLEKTYWVDYPYPRLYRIWVSKYAVRNGRSIFVKWTDQQR